MVRKKLIERLYDNFGELDEGTVLIDNKAFLDSVVGISSDGRAIYNYEIMASELVEQYGMSYEDACDYIDFNIIRALPYYGKQAPIVFDPIVNMD